MIGRTLQNRYHITRLLSGQGGSSDTYIAQDLHLPGQPDYVVKHFRPQFDRDGSRVAPEELSIAKQYFEREAQQLYNLQHDQIPKLCAQFEQDGEFFIVMDYIEGQLLGSELLPGRPWDEMSVVQLLADLLAVLRVVHQHGLIHRDIKPGNVIRRSKDNRLVLIDFGGVKEVATADYSRSLASPEPRTLFLGTPGYMPPEQAMRREAYPQSDLYAVGVIALQALTGRPAPELPYDSRRCCFTYQTLVSVSDRLQGVLDQLTAADWQQRYADANAAWTAVQALPTSPTVVDNLPLPSSPISAQPTHSIPPTIVASAPSSTDSPPVASPQPPVSVKADQHKDSRKPSGRLKKVVLILILLPLAAFTTLMYSALFLFPQVTPSSCNLNFAENDYSAWYEAAMCYSKRGEVDQSLDYLKRAIELHPQYRDESQIYVDFYPMRNDPRLQSLIQEP